MCGRVVDTHEKVWRKFGLCSRFVPGLSLMSSLSESCKYVFLLKTNTWAWKPCLAKETKLQIKNISHSGRMVLCYNLVILRSDKDRERPPGLWTDHERNILSMVFPGIIYTFRMFYSKQFVTKEIWLLVTCPIANFRSTSLPLVQLLL